MWLQIIIQKLCQTICKEEISIITTEEGEDAWRPTRRNHFTTFTQKGSDKEHVNAHIHTHVQLGDTIFLISRLDWRRLIKKSFSFDKGLVHQN